MAEQFDTIIAFVIIIAGLSMTLQLIVDSAKSVVGLRWKVYEAFLKDLYVEVLDKEVDDSGKKGPRVEIQSVTSRMRMFAGKLESLWGTAQEAREALVELRDGLGECETDEEKIELLRKRAESEIPQMRIWGQRIRSLNPESLLSVYTSLKDRVASGELSNLGGIDEGLAELDRLAESLRELTREESAELVAGIEAGIRETLEWMSRFEAKIGGIHSRIEANLDDALERLESNYAKHVKRWCFGLGIIVCVLLNADSISMYKTLLHTPVLSQSIIQERDHFLAEPAALPEGAELQAIAEAASELRAQIEEDVGHTDIEAFNTRFTTFQAALTEDLTGLQERTGPKEEQPARLQRADRALVDASEAMDEAAKAVADGTGEEAVRALNRAVGRITSGSVYLGAGQIEGRMEDLLASDLPLGWNPAAIGETFADFLALLKKALGIFATAVMISFGAPFWNDVLRSLLGLRGAVSKNKA